MVPVSLPVTVPLTYTGYQYLQICTGQCSGSGIRAPVLFYPPDPGSGMEQWSDSDLGSRDKQTKFVNSLYKKKRSDPGSGPFLPPGSGIQIRDGSMVGSGSGIRDKTCRIRNTVTGIGALGSKKAAF
jgi:hypothetical protein